MPVSLRQLRIIVAAIELASPCTLARSQCCLAKPRFLCFMDSAAGRPWIGFSLNLICLVGGSLIRASSHTTSDRAASSNSNEQCCFFAILSQPHCITIKIAKPHRPKKTPDVPDDMGIRVAVCEEQCRTIRISNQQEQSVVRNMNNDTSNLCAPVQFTDIAGFSGLWTFHQYLLGSFQGLHVASCSVRTCDGTESIESLTSSSAPRKIFGCLCRQAGCYARNPRGRTRRPPRYSCYVKFRPSWWY